MARFIVENVTSAPFSTPDGPGVAELSFEVGSGRCLALVGEFGSGRERLTRGLVRLEEFSSGSVRIDDTEVLRLSRGRFRRMPRGIQAVFSDSFGQLTRSLTLDRMFREVLAVQGRPGREETHQRIEQAMIRAGLSAAVRYMKPDHLDAMERQRAALARALLRNPAVLILHEFTLGLDAVSQAELLNQLRDLIASSDFALLVVTGHLSVACHLGDRLGVLHQGRLVEIGDTPEVIGNPTHDYTHRLLQLHHHAAADNS